jgi:hypothetical protein
LGIYSIEEQRFLNKRNFYILTYSVTNLQQISRH